MLELEPHVPLDFAREVADYDAEAEVGEWPGPRYNLRYRTLGNGPLLVLIPGIAATYRGYGPTLRRLARRFRTVIYDYPGEHPGDRADLGRITHDDLVDDVFGLIDHLEADRAYLFGLSFGTTITLSALHRRPQSFPKAALQGGFAHRGFSPAERMALLLGRRLPGTSARLPFRNQALAISSKRHFPSGQDDLWAFYLEQNGLTPIASLSHRLDLVSRLDLRPVLGEIPNEILLIQGDDDRIVGRRHFDELTAKLPGALGRLWPGVGHQPHYTHPGALAEMVGEWFGSGEARR